jgi:hypothetical protein
VLTNPSYPRAKTKQEKVHTHHARTATSCRASIFPRRLVFAPPTLIIFTSFRSLRRLAAAHLFRASVLSPLSNLLESVGAWKLRRTPPHRIRFSNIAEIRMKQTVAVEFRILLPSRTCVYNILLYYHFHTGPVVLSKSRQGIIIRARNV